MQAIISDIHANLEALEAVLNDIEALAVDDVICLGDIVGYGPDPEACIDLVMDAARVTLLGNHDHALLHGPTGFSAIAAEAIITTRELMLEQLKEENLCAEEDCLESTFLPCARQGRVPECLSAINRPSAQWRFIDSLPEREQDGDVLYVHASPIDPVFQYVFPDRIRGAWNPVTLRRMFDHVDWVSFCGHTHMPCTIDAELNCLYNDQVDGETVPLDPNCSYIINTGSVGQPRDRDPRACYLLFDRDKRTIQWRRIEYDIEAVAGKIEDMCGLSNFCAERLRHGR